MNSVITCFNRKNSNIIKVYGFLHQINVAIANIWFKIKTSHSFDAFVLLTSMPYETSIDYTLRVFADNVFYQEVVWYFW